MPSDLFCVFNIIFAGGRTCYIYLLVSLYKYSINNTVAGRCFLLFVENCYGNKNVH